MLLQAGAKINISNKTGRNALTIHITENETIHHETAMLLYAAGEQLENHTLKTLNDAVNEDLKSIRLDHLCREAIRKHLIRLDPHTHLFKRIPLLNLPHLTSYLLYELSIESKEAN